MVFDELESCVVFVANPFMAVDTGEISEQMAELVSVSSVKMQMEIINRKKSSPAKI